MSDVHNFLTHSQNSYQIFFARLLLLLFNCCLIISEDWASTHFILCIHRFARGDWPNRSSLHTFRFISTSHSRTTYSKFNSILNFLSFDLKLFRLFFCFSFRLIRFLFLFTVLFCFIENTKTKTFKLHAYWKRVYANEGKQLLWQQI